MKKIGLFDSGIGGLSLIPFIHAMLPDIEIFYIADDAFMPYGPKGAEVILQRCYVLVEKLLRYSVDMVVIACNTATAWAIDALRSHFSPILFVGVEPYVNYINKEPQSGEKLALLTTPLMQKSPRFQNLKYRLDPENRILVYPCPTLATLAEIFFYTGYQEKMLHDISRELDGLKGQGMSKVLLGCTHYYFLAPLISLVLGIDTVTPVREIALRVVSLIGEREALSLPSQGFHFERTLNNQIEFKTFEWLKDIFRTSLGTVIDQVLLR